MNPYRLRIADYLLPVVSRLGELNKVLDFGSGDGWFASRFNALDSVKNLTALDVKRRPNVHFEPQIYTPGEAIPFPDCSFDLVYSIDVLHHCEDPFYQLDELSRVSARYLLIKDHAYRTSVGRWTLAVLDELGNRRFGIPSLYQYQHGSSWTDHLSRRGWTLKAKVMPMKCHSGILGLATNGLQYYALYERQAATSS